MRALRLIVFGIVLALFALFAFSNWTRVNVVLPDGGIVAVYLPIVVFVAFLIGWLPLLLLHVASRAAARRRLAKVERLLEDALAGARSPPVASPTTVPMTAMPPSSLASPPPSPFPPAGA